MTSEQHRTRPPGQIKGNIFRPTYVSGRLLHERMTKALGRAAAESRPGFKVVYAGCGRQPYRALVEHFGASYVGIDVKDTIAGGYAPAGTLCISGDGTWPLADGSADVVMSTQVLEHVGDVDRYLGEARRVLGTGGRLLLSTHGAMIRHDVSDFWRWTQAGLGRLLEAHGF